ncbi:MAG: anthranilate synthase component I family protein, partial [Aestuariivirga sp.]
GYDMVRLMEELPPPNPDVLGLPDAMLIRPTVMAIFDSVRDEVTVTSPVYVERGIGSKAAYARARERLNEIVDALDRPLDHVAARSDDAPPMEVPRSNTSPEEYKAMVLKAKDYITAGDIFQVVLSQRFETEFTLPPFSLYRSVRRINPSPFLYYLDFDTFSVIGSSPELMVRVRDGKVTIRPIAGTRPRGMTSAEDRKLAAELLADPKERAEHLMLLDLGRNDVGRVADIGSIKVTDQFILEYYSHVMHIVSNVEGKLAVKYDAIDALVAGFPAGTVSGAPKVRAMEIIDELESEKRGVYAGCAGYFSADGEMDTCIMLRTAIVKDGKMYVQAGAGVVADSVPESEHQECINKAKALFRAAEDAVRFAGRAGRGQ